MIISLSLQWYFYLPLLPVFDYAIVYTLKLIYSNYTSKNKLLNNSPLSILGVVLEAKMLTVNYELRCKIVNKI